MNRIPLDDPLARGRTADVYAWDDGHVLKLFHEWFDLGDIEYELRIARAVHASGVKTPAVKELIQLDGRHGLIYERANGMSMWGMFQRQPWQVLAYGRTLARLHVQMHECIFTADVPPQQKRLQNKIRHAAALPAPLKSKLLDMLAALPEGRRVCHGDFHPGNILMSGGDATIIDWIDASCGNPLADVARTSIILLGSAGTDQVPNPFIKLFIRLFHAAYLHEYFRSHPNGRPEYRRWLPIVAAGRLTEEMPELETWLLEQARRI